MTAAEQLDLDAVFGGLPLKAKKKESPLTDVCKCTHERSDHEQGKGACSFAHCECVRFKTRARPIVAPTSVVRPHDAINWFRGPPEIETRKVGGWYVVTPTSLRVFMANTKIVSYNAVLKRAGGLAKHRPELAARLVAGDATRRKGFGYRTTAALEQARVRARGVPLRTTLTRVGSPRLRDDDNLVPSMKEIRDAIAEELGFDDSRFNIGGTQPHAGDVALFYAQTTAGARKAYAVIIEITWRNA